MNDAFARIALTAGIALAPLSITPGVAQATPQCPSGYGYGVDQLCWHNDGTPPDFNANCGMPNGQPDINWDLCIGAVRPIGPDTSTRTPVTTSAPPTSAYTTPAEVPTSNPQPPAPSNAVTVRQPRGVGASQSAIDSAKQNVSPADPENPPRPDKDVHQQVQDVVKNHSRNLDVVNGRVYPRHWDCTDHDADGNPMLINPTSQGASFRYYYQGSYQEAYVEAGSSISFTGVTGVFPFTAVGDTYLASGTFYGGTAPTVYENVAAYVPAYGQTVNIGTVQILGHDDSLPAGEQDTMMLNDTTLAHGQATSPQDGGQVTVAKTQTLPGVGPTDDGKSLVDLTATSQPQSSNTGIIVALVIGIGLAILALGVCIWVIRRKARTA